MKSLKNKKGLDQAAWSWAQNHNPNEITVEHILTAYRLRFEPCKPSKCRKICSGNPVCLSGASKIESGDSNSNNASLTHLQIRMPDKMVGLKNLGATCYANSLLQLWFHNVHFRKAIYDWEPEYDPHEKEASILASGPVSTLGHLQRLFALMQYGKRSHLDPSDFIRTLGLDTATQQDAQEFSKLFISLLENRLSHQRNEFVKNIVREQFCGLYSYVTKCSNCAHESQTDASFYELELNVSKTLDQSLSEFLGEERLEGANQYHCTLCNDKQDAVRTIRLKQLPPVLNLQLLRFVYERQKGCKKKIQSCIQFPIKLDMSKYLDKPPETCVYLLKAVLIHCGQSAYSGHYVAHIKDIETNMWYKFNDEVAEPLHGRNLNLGNEANPEEKKITTIKSEPTAVNNNGANKKKKSPNKSASGIHSSTNAYMLVYEQAPVPPKYEWTLNDRLKALVEIDSFEFDEQLKDKSQEMEQALAHVSRIKRIQSELNPTSLSGDNFELVATEWLSTLLAGKDPGPIEHKELLCKHDKLDPSKATLVKTINPVVMDELFGEHHGEGPRLKGESALCKECVQLKCKEITLKDQINEDAQMITNLLKFKSEKEDPQFWVSKYSLRNWRNLAIYLALESLGVKDKHYGSKPNPNSSPNDNEDASPEASGLEKNENSTEEENKMSEKEDENKIEREDEKTEKDDENRTEKEDEADEDEEPEEFNGDIVCKHGNLCVEENKRRLVSENVWNILRKYFSKCKEFNGNSQNCSECLENKVQSQEALIQNKAMANEQKQNLSDLFFDKNRPSFKKSVPSAPSEDTSTSKELLQDEEFYIVDSHFLDLWRKYIRRTTSKPDSALMVNELFCPHEKLLFDPTQSEDDKNRITLLNKEEWENLAKYYPTEKCIQAKADANGSVITTPGPCQECVIARMKCEQMELLNYERARIFIRKISIEEDDDITTPLKRHRPNNGDSDVAVPERSPGNGNSGNIVRKSTRVRRTRQEKELFLSSNCTLRDLKVKLMHRYGVAPYDQHLSLGNHELIDNNATLAQLNVFPNSVIELRVDEEVGDQAMFEEHYINASTPEEGFKGTELMK